MQRIRKHGINVRGFSLVEMLIVVGIIVILASAVALGVNDILSPAKKARNSVSVRAESQSKSISLRESKLINVGY